MPFELRPYEPPRPDDGGPTAVDEAVAKALGDHPDAVMALDRVTGVWKVLGSSTNAYWPH